LVISPFSRGGWVCGDTFDHTSILRFLEARFGVEVPHLTAWRRQTCGDLTTAFGFGQPPDTSVPTMPDTLGELRLVEARLRSLPAPKAPWTPSMPTPEVATFQRRRRGAMLA
jgi:phospholipase C